MGLVLVACASIRWALGDGPSEYLPPPGFSGGGGGGYPSGPSSGGGGFNRPQVGGGSGGGGADGNGKVNKFSLDFFKFLWWIT